MTDQPEHVTFWWITAANEMVMVTTTPERQTEMLGWELDRRATPALNARQAPAGHS
jgi:hypothetical protein